MKRLKTGKLKRRKKVRKKNSEKSFHQCDRRNKYEKKLRAKIKMWRLRDDNEISAGFVLRKSKKKEEESK